MSRTQIGRFTLVALALGLISSPVAAQRPGFQTITNSVSGLCLGVQGVDSHVAGGLVEVYTCNPGGGDAGRDNRWSIVQQADGFVQIRNQVSGLCLGVQGVDSHTSGALVEVYTCDGGGLPALDNQWRIVPQNDGTKQIQNRVSGLCLGVQGADSHGPGGQVEVYSCTSRRFPVRDQHWRM